MVVNNINKIALTEFLQPERKTGFKTLRKSVDFLIRVFRTCERAILECRKGHSCIATVALLQARLGPFRPVSDLQYVSVKFKRLIINVLEMSPKSHIYAERVVGCKYRKQRGRKQTNSLTVVELDAMATADGRGSLSNKKKENLLAKPLPQQKTVINSKFIIYCSCILFVV